MRYWGFQFGITGAVKYLILANVAIFLLNFVFGRDLFMFFGLVPALFWRGFLWQPVTYMFLHGGFFHLLINMLVLWMFGTSLESAWGTKRFLTFYLICGVSAALLNVIVMPRSPIPTVGASGAIYGLLMAFGILFPNQLIYFWGIIPVKAKYFVIGIGAIEFLAAMSSSRSGVAHVVHLGGMLFGLLYLKWNDISRSLTNRSAETRQKRYIHVVADRNREREDIQKKADELLDKINRSGIDSLTESERRLLEELARKMKDMDRKT